MDNLIDYNIRVSKVRVPNFEEECVYNGLITKNRAGVPTEEDMVIIKEAESTWRR